VSTTSTPIAVLFASMCLNPVEDVAIDRVDLVELNHFHDEQGQHVFDQIIFYDWSPTRGRYNVLAWRLLKQPAQVPTRDWSTGDFVTVWRDNTILREVRAQTKRESWTQYDPELIDRSSLPKEQRRELRKPLATSPATK
jgi:hypothetical protein